MCCWQWPTTCGGTHFNSKDGWTLRGPLIHRFPDHRPCYAVAPTKFLVDKIYTSARTHASLSPYCTPMLAKHQILVSLTNRRKTAQDKTHPFPMTAAWSLTFKITIMSLLSMPPFKITIISLPSLPPLSNEQLPTTGNTSWLSTYANFSSIFFY